MRPYVIWTPGYVTFHGGVAVLHRLCHEINQLGGTAYLFPSELSVNQEWNTPTLPSGCDVSEFIVIYPEIMKDNPLQATRIVRWLLAKAEIPDDGYTIAFSKTISRAHDIFYLNVVDESIWHPPLEESERSGQIVWRGKGEYWGTPLRDQDIGKTLVTRLWPPNQRELAELFRRSSLLISYDPLSAVNYEAAM